MTIIITNQLDYSIEDVVRLLSQRNNTSYTITSQKTSISVSFNISPDLSVNDTTWLNNKLSTNGEILLFRTRKVNSKADVDRVVSADIKSVLDPDNFPDLQNEAEKATLAKALIHVIAKVFFNVDPTQEEMAWITSKFQLYVTQIATIRAEGDAFILDNDLE
jgi:hypothetical protein